MGKGFVELFDEELKDGYVAYVQHQRAVKKVLAVFDVGLDFEAVKKASEQLEWPKQPLYPNFYFIEVLETGKKYIKVGDEWKEYDYDPDEDDDDEDD